jgi:HEAT repeat protein
MVNNLSDALLSTIQCRYRRSVKRFSTLPGLPGATPNLGVTARWIAAAALALLTALSFAQAQRGVAPDPKLVLELEGCPTLQACLAILDAVVPARDCHCTNGAGLVIAEKLRRFDEPAKQELLRRAAGTHPGWRNLAGDVLSHWGAWSPADVPALRAALQLDHGGWIARPLAEIKTPEAVQALVEDLAVIGSQSQTGWALVKIGPKALPYLIPILENDKGAHAAASVIREMGREALVEAPYWASLAASTGNPKNVRLAALRGLAAMGDGAQQQGKELREMLASPDIDIRAQAFKTLVAIRDPTVVATVAENCNPSGTAFGLIPIQSLSCLIEIAAFGDHARPVGSQLMKFLVTPNGDELATAVTALGYIGYDAAIPEIEQQLRAPDWRVVFAAARSLGWLAATVSIPELERVASDHWLPEVRDEALMAVDALKGSGRRMARPASFEGSGGARRLFSIGRFSFDRSIRQPSCGSGRWEWDDIRFSAPPRSTGAAHLSLGGGWLLGTNRGEWGGELTWMPVFGQSQLIIKDNVIAIEAAEGGAIVLFGLAHMGMVYGYAVRVSQRGDGGWSLSEVARLPLSADALAKIGPNLFAALSEQRVVVFSDKEIVGLARCIEK